VGVGKRARRAKRHRLGTRLAYEVQNDGETLTRPLNVGLKSRQPMIFDTFRQAPAESRHKPSFSRQEAYAIRLLLQQYSLLHAHHLHMVEIFGDAAHNLAVRVNFTLLDDPALCPRHYPLRSPFR